MKKHKEKVEKKEKKMNKQWKKRKISRQKYNRR